MSSGFSVQVLNGNQIAEKFVARSKVAVKIQEKEIKRLIQDVKKRAKSLAPVDTGALRCSIDSEMISKTSGNIFSQKSYAAHQECGTLRFAAQPY